MPDSRKYSDRAEYLKQAVAKRRKQLKLMLIKYKGGRCCLCGYHQSPEALDLHHIDSRAKSFGLSLRGLTRSWDRLRIEADKCMLICANCHRELHAGQVQLPRAIAAEKRGELRKRLN